MLQRPDTFRFNYHAPLAQELVFAGLGFRGSDKTTHFHDSSLYGNHGVLTNMDPAMERAFDSELGRFRIDLLGGKEDGNRIAWSGVYTASTTWTISLWAMSTLVGTARENYLFDCDAGRICIGWGAGSADNKIGIYIASWQYWTTSPRTNAWTHIAVVTTGTSSKLYLNAVPYAPVTISAKSLGGTVSWGTRYTYSGTTWGGFVGRISDPMIYSRALDASEIQQLADPSNVTYSGLILPPRRKLWPVATSGTYSTTIEMPVFQLTI